ncbi:MAG: NUDIX hydrolase [Rhodobacteraceae bacterium CG17_big_fil_post_rev_8_21_14_2_50_63_15]|nr:MAG: NUDIX hydrolase [Rhodobacteraceae bacterium CG17_big_fil_post_rev_8_21_14_2_50_63_15]
MTQQFSDASGAVPVPPFPPDMQVAALCWRKHKGRTEVLLITSRDTGRWIVPKGWPINGLNAPQSALREAWEEAGVRADAEQALYVGQFCYDKLLANGQELPVRALLYKIRLRSQEITNRYPESHERKRLWVTPLKAAKLVQEPELQEILRSL